MQRQTPPYRNLGQLSNWVHHTVAVLRRRAQNRYSTWRDGLDISVHEVKKISTTLVVIAELRIAIVLRVMAWIFST